MATCLSGKQGDDYTSNSSKVIAGYCTNIWKR